MNISQIRFLADNDLRDAIVDGLFCREPSIEFARARELELHELSDAEVLAWAAEQRMVVVSHDVNTMTAEASRRIQEGQAMCGLIVCHQDQPVAMIIDSLLLIWSATDLEEWTDMIKFLPL